MKTHLASLDALITSSISYHRDVSLFNPHPGWISPFAFLSLNSRKCVDRIDLFCFDLDVGWRVEGDERGKMSADVGVVSRERTGVGCHDEITSDSFRAVEKGGES